MKHPYLKEFFDPADLNIHCKKIKLPIDDNRRLSLKDYRALIYE